VINRFLVSTDGITGSEEYYYIVGDCSGDDSLPRVVELSLPKFLDEAECGNAEMCSIVAPLATCRYHIDFDND
ncbi:4238_t:CDS:2, partial [Acaulospora morrowiae]